ncbi:MAG TPA: HlyD family type I secretion periplasmic adaptor subunit, partial [Caulobacteraceae bacterium]
DAADLPAIGPQTGGKAPPSLDDRPESDVRAGLVIAALFFVGFLGWAAFVPLDAGATASGAVVVSGSRQAVQHQTGGVVSALHVREGDRVRAGQVLVEISAGETRAVERGLTAQVLALLAQRARLAAERDGLASVTTPSEFATLSGEDRALADEAFRLQLLQFRARGSGISNQRAVLVQRERQLNEQISGLNQQIASNVRQQSLIGEELRGMRSLAAQGYAPENRVRALERTAAALEGEQGSLNAQVARSREAIGETRLQIAGLRAERGEDVNEQLRQAEIQLNELRPRLTAAREQLARALVRSPATGQVVGLTAFTVGGVVEPGRVLAEVVPQSAALVIEARVRPDDADDLRVGQTVEARFVAFRERDLPRLTGRITSVSADSFEDERSGERYFKATAEIPADQMAVIRNVRGTDTGLRPGLPVELVVPLRKRTALQYILEPLTQSLWRSFREH